MALSSRITLIAALALAAFQAQAVNVTVAYQTSAEPAKVAQADNTFAKASGATVDWRKFDSGASIVRALASGDVQIGNLGSSPLAVAATQQVPIEVFLLASKLGNSEALVVKKSITKPQDLIGKRIAVPFISTTHYSLLSALKHWGIKPGQVQILNLQPPAIIAAWQRGDIDGAYVWAPAVNALEKEGTVLTDSSQVGEWGAPTLDVWVVRKDFAEKHPDIVKAFAKSAIDAQQPSTPLLQVGKRRSRASWLKQPEFTLLNYQQPRPRCPMFRRFSPTRSIIWTQTVHQRSSSSTRSIGSPSRSKTCCCLVSNTALSGLSAQRQRTLASLSTARSCPGALSLPCRRSPMTTSTRSSSGPFIIQMD